MNLKIYLLLTLVCSAIAAFGCVVAYHNGWDDGRANLVDQQAEQARIKLAAQITRQQQDDTRAALADESGKAKTITITQEVVKYVKTPGSNVCIFDDVRLQLKSRAVDNANNLIGFDDAAVQTGTASR